MENNKEFFTVAELASDKKKLDNLIDQNIDDIKNVLKSNGLIPLGIICDEVGKDGVKTSRLVTMPEYEQHVLSIMVEIIKQKAMSLDTTEARCSTACASYPNCKCHVASKGDA